MRDQIVHSGALRSLGRWWGRAPGGDVRDAIREDVSVSASGQMALRQPRGGRRLFVPMGALSAVLGVLIAHQVARVVPADVPNVGTIRRFNDRPPYSLGAWRNISAYALPSRASDADMSQSDRRDPEFDDDRVATLPSANPAPSVAARAVVPPTERSAGDEPRLLIDLAIASTGPVPMLGSRAPGTAAASVPAAPLPSASATQAEASGVLPTKASAARPTQDDRAASGSAPASPTAAATASSRTDAPLPPLPIRKPHWLIRKSAAAADPPEQPASRAVKARNSASQASEDKPAKAAVPKSQPVSFRSLEQAAP